MMALYMRLGRHSSKLKGIRNGYAYGTPELQKILGKFRIEARLIDVRLFQMLTPDSFMWKLRMSDGIYCLYAEDYVEKLECVENEIRQANGDKIGKFIPVKIAMSFEKHLAVKAATVYTRSESYADMRPFAADSGYDLVFLYKLENPDRQDQ